VSLEILYQGTNQVLDPDLTEEKGYVSALFKERL
jgi:hypothetical protein